MIEIPGSFVPFKKIVQFRAEKKNADAEIQPQHQQDNGGKASVHVGVIAEIVKIYGESIRKPDPAQGGKQGSGELIAHLLFLIRNDGIKSGKNKREKGQRQQSTETDNMPGNAFQKRKYPENQILDGCAKHQQNKREDAGDHKQESISCTDNPRRKISSSAFAFKYSVQTSADA